MAVRPVQSRLFQPAGALRRPLAPLLPAAVRAAAARPLARHALRPRVGPALARRAALAAVCTGLSAVDFTLASARSDDAEAA